MKKNWLIAEKKYDDVIKQILHNRGVKPESELEFLEPDFNNGLLPSEDLPNFGIFRLRINQAIADHEKVGIFADYDADGIPGAAFLYRSLKRLGLSPEVYIPSREDGYGLNQQGIDTLIEKKCTLIITVDLGIKNHKEAHYCKQKGVDLIITDHHLPSEEVPEALAVINPKLKGSVYRFEDLSGAGVAFKLVCGLAKHHPALDEKFLKWNLDLIAISTISDVVPLVGENRVIASYGLLVLRKTKNIGLKALYAVAKIDAPHIGAYQVGFMIGPRINAPGRLTTPSKSFELLTTDDRAKADEIARELEEENLLRQEMMEELFEEAEREIESRELQKQKIIILKGDWTKGIIGPSASRLAEKYCRPIILLSEDADGITGSARSINDINITEILKEASDVLDKFGGHKGAAGLSLKTENYQKAYDKILQIADKVISEDQLKKVYRADMLMDFDQLTFELSDSLKKLEPFGMGNPRPVFATTKAILIDPKYVGAAQNHLSLSIEQQNKKIKSIYFNCEKTDYKHQDNVSLLYSFDDEEWNGRHYLKINIIDMENHLR